jgi:hypothetical protein
MPAARGRLNASVQSCGRGRLAPETLRHPASGENSPTTFGPVAPRFRFHGQPNHYEAFGVHHDHSARPVSCCRATGHCRPRRFVRGTRTVRNRRGRCAAPSPRLRTRVGLQLRSELREQRGEQLFGPTRRVRNRRGRCAAPSPRFLGPRRTQRGDAAAARVPGRDFANPPKRRRAARHRKPFPSGRRRGTWHPWIRHQDPPAPGPQGSAQRLRSHRDLRRQQGPVRPSRRDAEVCSEGNSRRELNPLRATELL